MGFELDTDYSKQKYEYTIICYDTAVDNLKCTGLSDEDFNDIRNEDIKAGKLILYLDTCHAGLSGLSKLYKRKDIGVIEVNNKINQLAARISESKHGVAKFSASSANGYSLEDLNLKGGVHSLVNSRVNRWRK